MYSFADLIKDYHTKVDPFINESSIIPNEIFGIIAEFLDLMVCFQDVQHISTLNDFRKIQNSAQQNAHQLLSKLEVESKKFIKPLSKTLSEKIKPLIESIQKMSTNAMKAFQKLAFNEQLESAYVQSRSTIKSVIKDEAHFWRLITSEFYKWPPPKPTQTTNAQHKESSELSLFPKIEIEKNINDLIVKFKMIALLNDLTTRLGGTFIQHIDENQNPISISIEGHCRGIVFDWGYKLKYNPPSTKAIPSSEFIKFTKILQDIKANKFPNALYLKYALLGEDNAITSSTIRNQFYYEKITESAGKPTDFDLNCEGNTVAKEAIAFLNHLEPSNTALNKSKQESVVLEIILKDIILKDINVSTRSQFCNHQIGMAKFIIDGKPVYRVKDGLFGEFEFSCLKKFAEWLNEYFKLLEYNTLFFGFSIRKIDISIDEALSKHLASNTQTLQVNSATTTPQFSGYKTKSTTLETHQTKEENNFVRPA